MKRTPRAWYQELKSFFFHYGFHNLQTNVFIFIYKTNEVIVYFLVYIDDLIVIRNNSNFIDQFIIALLAKFSVKNLGALNFFLGIEVILGNGGLFLKQHKYIQELLKRSKMLDAKNVCTLMSSNPPLVLDDGSSPIDSKIYRSVIRTL